MSNKIATEEYVTSLTSGWATTDPTRCATKTKVEYYGLGVNGTYQDNQLVKEQDIIVKSSKFLVNTELGALYVVEGTSQTPVSVAGLSDFVYIAGGYGSVGVLSMTGGLYTYNVDTDAWTAMYSAYGSTFAHLARFDGGYVFYRTQGSGSNLKYYIVVAKDDQTSRVYNISGPVYSISAGPYNYCLVGSYYQGGARMYTFQATSLPNSLTYYVPGMFTPEASIQGFYRQPKGVVYCVTSNYTYYTSNPGGTTWNPATVKPQLTTITKGMYANNEFMLIGGKMKSVSKDGGQNWNTSTLGTFQLADLIYESEDASWYAVGMSGTKRFFLQNTASTFDETNMMFNLPDHSRQLVKL